MWWLFETKLIPTKSCGTSSSVKARWRSTGSFVTTISELPGRRPVRAGTCKQKRYTQALSLTKPWVGPHCSLPYFIFSPFKKKKLLWIISLYLWGYCEWREPGPFKMKPHQRRTEDTPISPVIFLTSLSHASGSLLCCGMVSCLNNGQSKQAAIVWWNVTEERKPRKKTF